MAADLSTRLFNLANSRYLRKELNTDLSKSHIFLSLNTTANALSVDIFASENKTPM